MEKLNKFENSQLKNILTKYKQKNNDISENKIVENIYKNNLNNSPYNNINNLDNFDITSNNKHLLKILYDYNKSEKKIHQKTLSNENIEINNDSLSSKDCNGEVNNSLKNSNLHSDILMSELMKIKISLIKHLYLLDFYDYQLK